MKKTKQKIRKSISTRFRVTKNGKVVRRSSFLRHLRSNKTKSQVRSLKTNKTVGKILTKKITRLMGK